MLEGLKRNIDAFQREVGRRLNAEYGIQLGLTEDDLQTIYDHGPREFLTGGPNSVMYMLEEMTQLDPESREAALNHIIDRMIKATMNIVRYTLAYREDDAQAI